MGFETALRNNAGKEGIDFLVDQAIENVSAKITNTDSTKQPYAAAVVQEYQRLKAELNQYINS